MGQMPNPPPKSAIPNRINLQVFHLLDTILTVCYIRQVFRCIRHDSGMLIQ